MSGYLFSTCPKYAGAYWLGKPGIGLGVYLERRPRWLHRVCMRLALGWQWIDGP